VCDRGEKGGVRHLDLWDLTPKTMLSFFNDLDVIT